MIIRKIAQNNYISANNKLINNFGINLDLSYAINSDNQYIIINITYEISLIENYDTLFGKINCTYEFLIENNFENGSFKNLKENILRTCLKENHFNIKDLIEDILKEDSLTHGIANKHVMN